MALAQNFTDIFSLLMYNVNFTFSTSFQGYMVIFQGLFKAFAEQCVTLMSALEQREKLQDCCHAPEPNKMTMVEASTPFSRSKIYNVICLSKTQVQYSMRMKIYTYLHTSLALENVLVLITSGAIHAYVPAALIRVVVTISLASPKSVIFNTFSKLPSSILFRSKTEKKGIKIFFRILD